MQLSETITIYLAVGAPFGVNYFLREHAGHGRSRARSLFRATSAGLLWPLVAVVDLLARSLSAAPLSSSVERHSVVDDRMGNKITTAQQQFAAALERVREVAQTPDGVSEDLEQSMRAVREGIEKYVGLTLALAEASPEDQPTSRETELCRIAGREGNDLWVAGRCIHRRNVARLVAHHARSRTELLHALAAVRETAHQPCAVSPPDGAQQQLQLSAAVLKFYGQAINLLSLLEDESAAMSVARLLNAECARLRSLEALSSVSEELVGTDGKHARHRHTPQPTLAQR